MPPQTPPTFDGLLFGGPYTNPDGNGDPVAAGNPTGAWPPAQNPHVVPYPDPGEPFDQVTQQIANGAMNGFVQNYLTQKGVTSSNADQIMQSYSSQQLTVLSTLAASFAVSDAWFCSVPTQTWPNRAFVHAASSEGNVVNSPFPALHDRQHLHRAREPRHLVVHLPRHAVHAIAHAISSSTCGTRRTSSASVSFRRAATGRRAHRRSRSCRSTHSSSRGSSPNARSSIR